MQGVIRTTRLGTGVWVICLAGEHDLSTADALRERLETATRTGTGVVLDLGEASIIDTSIVEVILAQPWTGFALVIPADGAIAKMVDRLMLHDALAIYASRLVACREVAPRHRMLRPRATTHASPPLVQEATASSAGSSL
ncbi:MAG: hypothetical protein QOJ13_406 [Gaiellales bacterium]|jgi:hypothetical protein|nr:hypothetical protein [Gaiellales bacterium]